MTQHSYQLAVAGAGKMGGALIRSLLERGELRAAEIIAADAQPSARDALAQACPGVTVVEDIAEAAACADTLIIAVKPQNFEDALGPAAGERPAQQLVISIMAGVRIERIEALLREGAPVIRAMPNVLCEVAEGAFGYAVNPRVSPAQEALADRWFNSIGAAEKLPEDLLDAVTGLSGSGPAFVAVFIEALADGGVAAGLPRRVAERLASQTVLGAGKWVRDTGGPASLKDMVTSPAGTTITGVRALEAGALRSSVIEAVVAAAERSKELGR